MLEPTLKVQGNGDLLFAGLGAPFLEVLQELPGLLKLAHKDPRSRKRLLPDVFDDEENNKEWRKHCTPEMEHLFKSAAELIDADIAQMERDPLRARTWRMRIPAKHHTAWMSSLNAARVALGEVYHIEEADMAHGRPIDPASARDSVILKIHLLGWLEELLVDAAGF